MKLQRAIRARRDFQRVCAQGRRGKSDGLTVFAAPGTGASAGGRIGFSVTRSVGSAVVRNRTRRRLREASRALPGTPGLDVVVRAEGAAGSLGYQELSERLAEALAAAGAGRSP